jgi:hypothetical protein
MPLSLENNKTVTPNRIKLYLKIEILTRREIFRNYPRLNPDGFGRNIRFLSGKSYPICAKPLGNSKYLQKCEILIKKD